MTKNNLKILCFCDFGFPIGLFNAPAFDYNGNIKQSALAHAHRHTHMHHMDRHDMNKLRKISKRRSAYILISFIHVFF